jgi:hypothetical protein
VTVLFLFWSAALIGPLSSRVACTKPSATLPRVHKAVR